tara:strand:- start:2082 stop:2273 length:192 start_codon:yes stop_codon:yes gene_type:complete
VQHDEQRKAKKELYGFYNYRGHPSSFVKTHKSNLLGFDKKTSHLIPPLFKKELASKDGFLLEE